jgi:hypothetical protein
VRLEGLSKRKKSNDLIGSRTRDLPARSIVPHATTQPRALFSNTTTNNNNIYTNPVRTSHETWNLASNIREEHRLRVFENKMLRKIFGPKRD